MHEPLFEAIKKISEEMPKEYAKILIKNSIVPEDMDDLVKNAIYRYRIRSKQTII